MSKTVMGSALIRTGIPLLLGVLLIVSLVGLVPRLHGRVRLSRELEATTLDRQVQERLYPAYMALQTIDRLTDRPGLDLPTRRPLSRESVPALPDRLLDLVETHAFRADGVPMKVVSDGDRRVLAVDLELAGRYDALGPLLADLIRLPAYDALDRLAVSREQGEDRVQVRMRMVLE